MCLGMRSDRATASIARAQAWPAAVLAVISAWAAPLPVTARARTSMIGAAMRVVVSTESTGNSSEFHRESTKSAFRIG
jgi:hypothetical protein